MQSINLKFSMEYDDHAVDEYATYLDLKKKFKKTRY